MIWPSNHSIYTAHSAHSHDHQHITKYTQDMDGQDGQEVMESILILTCFSMFKRKVGWESCGRDGCGEEDGGSRVRRWRHLKACHQEL